jgi:hypothetical protein
MAFFTIHPRPSQHEELARAVAERIIKFHRTSPLGQALFAAYAEGEIRKALDRVGRVGRREPVDVHVEGA